MTFKDDKDGSVKTVQAPLGKSILEVAHENDVELEGEPGPCEALRRRILGIF